MAPDLTILGGGAWGTALALQLGRAGRTVSLWVHDPVLAAVMRRDRVNAAYLPGHTLPPNVSVTSDVGEALAGARDVMLVVPSHHCREVLRACLPHMPHMDAAMSFCSASKGIENDSLLRVSEILADTLGEQLAGRIAVMSGPSFADEVASGHPTAVVIASNDGEVAARLQRTVSTGGLRAYTSADVIGVELGGALKNVVAIGAGVVDGLGYGTNTLAALITRGLAEISRLAEACGGRRETLAGLAGLGDLVLTCTGRLSRNRALGVALARGATLQQHQAATRMVAEGVRTTLSAWRMASRLGVEMPITSQVHAVLYKSKSPSEAIKDLLARQLRREDS